MAYWPVATKQSSANAGYPRQRISLCVCIRCCTAHLLCCRTCCCAVKPLLSLAASSLLWYADTLGPLHTCIGLSTIVQTSLWPGRAPRRRVGVASRNPLCMPRAPARGSYDTLHPEDPGGSGRLLARTRRHNRLRSGDPCSESRGQTHWVRAAGWDRLSA